MKLRSRGVYSLLSEAEQLLLRRLAIFASAFTLDAAEAVVPDERLQMVQVLDLLEHLVDQSLVQMDDTFAEARFRMLETVRQFARRELERAAEVDSARGASRDRTSPHAHAHCGRCSMKA